MSEQFLITAKTKVAALLQTYPQLESTLIDYAPAFAKLRNPVLRRTVAKVATLAQAARVAGVEVGELVLALRREVGQSSVDTKGTDSILEHPCNHSPEPLAAPEGGELPEWARAGRVRDELRADDLLEAGETPLGPILRSAHSLKPGELLCVSSSFAPAPLVDTLLGKGYSVHSRAVGDGSYETLIAKP